MLGLIMRRKYKKQELQRVYDHYRNIDNAPYYKSEKYGKTIEWHGANIRNAYWCGRHDKLFIGHYRTTVLHAAYMAGKDVQVEENAKDAAI